MRTDFQNVRVEHDESVVMLTMNRPDVLNAINELMLEELIGLGRALEMALLANEVSGAEAERIGLVNRCVSLAEFDDATRALAKQLANGPTRAYGLIKELLYTSLEMDLQASLHLEGRLQDAAYATADHREAVDAFLHKRAAKFTGK